MKKDSFPKARFELFEVFTVPLLQPQTTVGDGITVELMSPCKGETTLRRNTTLENPCCNTACVVRRIKRDLA